MLHLVAPTFSTSATLVEPWGDVNQVGSKISLFCDIGHTPIFRRQTPVE